MFSVICKFSFDVCIIHEGVDEIIRYDYPEMRQNRIRCAWKNCAKCFSS